MSQITPLINTLKKQLKAAAKTYADVAVHLNLSEASVKRLFACEHFTLQRLEQVCHLLGLELSELLQLMESEQQRIVHLSREQEQIIVDDTLLLLISISVINGYTIDDITSQYDVTLAQCIQKLAILDRLNIIELMPNNRIRLRVASNFNWLPNGPIQQYFQRSVVQDFFNSQFDQEHELLLVLNGLLTNASNSELQKKLRKLAVDLHELAKQDQPQPMAHKYGNTVVLAVRKWRFGGFTGYLKKSLG